MSNDADVGNTKQQKQKRRVRFPKHIGTKRGNKHNTYHDASWVLEEDDVAAMWYTKQDYARLKEQVILDTNQAIRREQEYIWKKMFDLQLQRKRQQDFHKEEQAKLQWSNSSEEDQPLPLTLEEDEQRAQVEEQKQQELKAVAEQRKEQEPIITTWSQWLFTIHRETHLVNSTRAYCDLVSTARAVPIERGAPFTTFSCDSDVARVDANLVGLDRWLVQAHLPEKSKDVAASLSPSLVNVTPTMDLRRAMWDAVMAWQERQHDFEHHFDSDIGNCDEDGELLRQACREISQPNRLFAIYLGQLMSC